MTVIDKFKRLQENVKGYWGRGLQAKSTFQLQVATKQYKTMVQAV